jgi:hypothetical protein
VPPGKYELVCRRQNGPRFRQIVETTQEQPNRQVRLAPPAGTASVSGRLPKNACAYVGCCGGSPIKFWSHDGHLQGYGAVAKDGSYRIENLPAGDYRLVLHDTRDAEALVEFSVREGEHRTLDIPKEAFASVMRPRGYLVVRVFSPEGVLLPACDVQLDGPQGRPVLSSSQHGSHGFVGKPGMYELIVSYPTYRPIHRTVEMKPTDKDGRGSRDCVVDLRFESSGP